MRPRRASRRATYPRYPRYPQARLERFRLARLGKASHCRLSPPGKAGRQRAERLGSGLRETRRRSARIEADDAAERAKQKKKREAQAEPTFFEIVRRRTGAFGQTEPRRGTRWSLLQREPSPNMRRGSNASMDRRLGNRKKSSDFGRNPRDRPGPKGLGRNLPRDELKPSPARDSDSGEVGAGSNAGPHFLCGQARR